MWRKVRICLQVLASVVFMAFFFIVALRDQIAKSLIWLPLSVGVGGTGASKKKHVCFFVLATLKWLSVLIRLGCAVYVTWYQKGTVDAR